MFGRIAAFASVALISASCATKAVEQKEVVSIPVEPYSIAEMARDIAELAQHLNITSAYFCGNSMGGFILQELAYQFPSLVKKMIISN